MILDKKSPVFFCGIGGSGMMPLALILAAHGFNVSGSDRAYDISTEGGDSLEKFQILQNAGIALFPQNGTGITTKTELLIVSSAIEESIPDVQKAQEKNIPIQKRADILSELFHLSDCSIGISGTSGKTTVTGMIATILQALELNPTVVNGGCIKNIEQNKNNNGSLLVGDNHYFVAEMDESDGSIDLFTPDIALLNNIALDHTSLAQLKTHFQRFIDSAHRACVLNWDNENVRALKRPEHALTYGINNEDADFNACNLKPRPDGIDFEVNGLTVHLKVPGHHNVSNALAALCVGRLLKLDLKKTIQSLELFTGIKRRLETLGISQNNVTVIDDFGHNPDKIAVSLATLKEFDGRLIIMFQPHGFAPLRLMGREMADVFAHFLDEDDILCIPEVYYAGGTVDRSVTSKDFVEMMQAKGKKQSHWFQTRKEIAPFIKEHMKSEDRVVVMGARDDTLTLFAKEFL